ncbi:hypothetical protein ETAA8_41980 [Anatilimnocola aggregata]|uniref:Uncharacterized protein n=1 Tax=Anatilimnocola aggregata TaxID=2528021 RepID=A0A517YFW7_9BACT|nr:hypothetical protein [Anatilimnocola aggregata]QDU29091.1 hypothetical protein ETAA8_41980 [Anatilimnocola aggregata]
MTNRAPLIVAIVLLLLPVLYVGSYFALLSEGPKLRMTSSGFCAHVGKYRVAEPWCRCVFWPLEQIDRMIRPEL